MCGSYYRAVTGDNSNRPPLSRDYPFYVVFQAEGSDPEVDDARFERVLGEALEEGLISMDAIDCAVRRTLEFKFKLGLFERPYVDEGKVMGMVSSDLLAQRYLLRLLRSQAI